MSLGKFNLLEKDTRLIKYKDRIYKVKLQFRTQKDNADGTLPCNQDDIQSEMEAAIRAVLAMPGDLHPIRTKHFVVHPERKYWNTASLLKFYEHGKELTGDPHMLYLTVETLPDDQSRDTGQYEQMQEDGDGPKDMHEENDNQKAGPSSRGTKATRTTSQDSRQRKRRKAAQSKQANDSESTTDVSDSDRPRFNSPPTKHRRYALRKRAASNPYGGGEPSSRGKRMLLLSRQNRYMVDSLEERVQEGASGSQQNYEQASPDNIHYAATASNQSQPAHPQGGVILQEMLRPSAGEIAQHQLEEQMRLQRLAGPSAVNRSHPAFSAPADRADVEPPQSALRKIINVVLTPAKKLFSK